MIGKPYSGKLNVRFDEGELEIGLLPLRQFSTLPQLPSPVVNRIMIWHDSYDYNWNQTGA